ncbi:MAG TPA: type II secretion system protein [Bryobacteraceae bacterium]|nr:type II secretion system protein [Bryobacteraceae bacterium]
MKRTRGFTLLEMLVATAIMAMVIGGVLQLLSTSLRNASRLTDYDRSVLLARRKLDELLTERRLPYHTPIEGAYDMNSGWRALVTPFELPPNPAAGSPIIARVQVEIWTQGRDQRRTFALEGYRRSILTQQDIQAGVLLPR